jgi:polysaccharide export outer membrane protein
MKASTGFWNSKKRSALFLPLCLLLSTAPARAEYRLQPGDVLEVSITGIPELRQRLPVGAEGDVSVALAGQVSVRGLTVAEARAKIIENLSNKVYQQRANDGRDVNQLILSDAVIVNVAEYRPVYLNGDISRPGEQAFRPGMTVRHAIAVAGGYDSLQMRGQSSFVQRIDLRTDYETLWAEYAREKARVWRLRTELGEKNAEIPSAKTIALPRETIDLLIKTEEERLKVRTWERQKEREHYEKSINSANEQLKVLAEKKRKDEEAIEADTADFEKVRELFQKGMTATTRLSEARRSVVLSSTQLLQTVVEITNIERQRDEFERLLNRVDSQSKAEILAELQEANLRLEQVSVRLQGTGEKLRIRNGQPEIWVFRTTGSGTERISANEEMELVPGDVVDITLQAEALTR